MAYAAVATLVQSLQQLFKPDHDNPCPLHYPQTEIEAIRDKLVLLQSSLDMIYPVRNSVRPSVTDLEIRIRDAMYKAQETIESIIASQSHDPKPKEDLLGDLQEILAIFDPITELAVAKAVEIQEERKKLPPEEIAPETKSETSKREVNIIEQEKDQKSVLQNVLLPNLLTLSNVNAAHLSKQVLQNVPNLQKLGIWVEEPCSLELHLDVLEKIESLKFTVVNPIPGSQVQFLPKFSFPETLTKLTLSGTGIPWEDMEVIAELPNLQVLKLRKLSCQGVIWEPVNRYFELKYLLLEALELKKWDADGCQFPALEHLAIRHCYELEEMPLDMDHIAGLHMIELADCSKKAMEWAKVIQKKLEPDDENTDAKIQFNISSSWE